MDSFLVVSCLLAFVAVTSANPPYALPYLSHVSAVDSISDPSYGFNYAVNDPSTGDNKAQWETRHGDVVHGAYSLVEPDGNIRLVEYTADPIRGFNAVVKRTGPNLHSIGPVLAPMVKTIAPIVHEPISHGPLLAPLIEAPLLDHGPVIAPLPAWELPYLPAYNPDPWVSLSGTTYGAHGHVKRRWAAGPINLHGKTLTIKTRH